MSQEFDSVIKGYSSEGSIKNYSKLGLWKSEETLIDKYFSEGSVLDIGCGGGRTTIPLAKKGYEVTAIDVVPYMIELTKENAITSDVKINLEQMTVTNLKYKASAFDYALFSDAGIEHLSPEKLPLAIKEIYRVLKPGGIFIFTAHSILYPGPFMIEWFRWIKRCIRKDRRTKYFGDKYETRFNEEIYHHYASPGYYLKNLKKLGFSLIVMMPKSKLEEGGVPSILDRFSEGQIFYVAQK